VVDADHANGGPDERRLAAAASAVVVPDVRLQTRARVVGSQTGGSATRIVTVVPTLRREKPIGC